jgi:hypothetical protein
VIGFVSRSQHLLRAVVAADAVGFIGLESLIRGWGFTLEIKLASKTGFRGGQIGR